MLGRTLGALALAALRRSGVRTGVAVYYHKVGDPPGVRSRELVPAMSISSFDAHLRYLDRHYTLVAASDLLPAIRARRRGDRLPAAITLDDDLPSHSSVAGPLLARRGIPGTFFLCGASLSAPFSFWWEHVDAVTKSGGEDQLLPLTGVDLPDLPVAGPRDVVKSVALAIEAMTQSDRRAVLERIQAREGRVQPGTGMAPSDIRELAAMHHELGFHTVDHDPMTTLTDDELAEALRFGRAELEHVAGRPLDVIAYPHGASDARTHLAAGRTGYRFGFTTRHTAIVPDDDPLALGRVEAEFLSVGELAWLLAVTLLRRARRIATGS